MLNARIRKAWLRGARVARIGAPASLSYDPIDLGTGREALSKLAAMDHSDKHGTKGVTIVGQGALRGEDGAEVLAVVRAMAEAAQSDVLVLHTAASRVGAMDVGATCEGGVAEALGADVVYNLGADEVDVPAGPFVIYQGSHGDRGAHRADVILPAAAWTEEQGLFVNTEGRPQLALRAGFAPGDAKENWAILRALSAEVGHQLPFDSLAQLRRAMVDAAPQLGEIDAVPVNKPDPLGETPTLGTGDFEAAVRDFYLTNPIARASKLMGELQALASGRDPQPIAAE